MDYLAIIPFVEVAELESIKEELAGTLDKSQMFRTRTEMEISVLNDTKFPTASSKYWQAMKEQNVHFTELVRLSYEYKRNQVRKAKLKKQILQETDELDKELLIIDLEELRFTMVMQTKVARERVREILNWSDIKQREAFVMSAEELADVDNHQLISYTKRWIKQSIAMGGGGSPAERQNLLGQLRSGILACIDNGVLEYALSCFPRDGEVYKKIKEDYKNEIAEREGKSHD